MSKKRIACILCILFLIMLLRIAAYEEQNPTVELDMGLPKEEADILIHEEFFYVPGEYGKDSFTVKRYWAFNDVDFTCLNINYSSEKKLRIWDYRQYDTCEDEQNLQEFHRFIEFTLQDNKRFAKWPTLCMNKTTSTKVEIYNVGGRTEYVGPDFFILRYFGLKESSWFPFDEYRFSRTISPQENRTILYSSKIILPPTLEVKYEFNVSNSSGISSPCYVEKSICRILYNKTNYEILRKDMCFKIFLIGEEVRYISDFYEYVEGEYKRSVLIPPTCLRYLGVIKADKLELNIFLKRPGILKQIFLFSIFLMFFSLHFSYDREKRRFVESKLFEICFFVWIFQEGIVTLVSFLRPFQVTVFDLTICIPFLFMFILRLPRIYSFFLSELRFFKNFIINLWHKFKDIVFTDCRFLWKSLLKELKLLRDFILNSYLLLRYKIEDLRDFFRSLAFMRIWTNWDWFIFFEFIPFLLILFYLMSPLLKNHFVLVPLKPTIVSIFFSNYFHTDFWHFFQNLLSYIVVLFLIFNIERDKNVFYKSSLLTFTLLPILSSLYIVIIAIYRIPNFSPTLGFSAILSAFSGYLIYAIYSFAKRFVEELDFNFFLLLLTINFIVLPFNLQSTPLLVMLPLVYGLLILKSWIKIKALSQKLNAKYRRLPPNSAIRKYYWILSVLLLTAILSFASASIPEKIVVGNTVINTISHYLGYLFGGFIPFCVRIMPKLDKSLLKRYYSK